MISLRLTRVGKKKRPLYRLIAIPKHKDPWSKCLEYLGIIDPRTKERTLKTDRIKYWLSVGAQPSDTVHNLLVDEKVIEGKKTSVTSLSKKRTAKITEAEKAAVEKKAADEAKKVKAAEEAEAAKVAEAEAAKVAAEEAEAAKVAEAEATPLEEAPAETEAPAEEVPTEPIAE